MTTELRALIDAYADAFEAHEQSAYALGHASAEHGEPRKRSVRDHGEPLEHVRRRYRATSDALRAAYGAILAALEAT